jgi:hypothetical protein
VVAVLYKAMFHCSQRPLVTRLVPKKIKELNLKDFRNAGILNYFIFGNLTTIKKILDIAKENKLLVSQFMWHVITTVSSDLHQY